MSRPELLQGKPLRPEGEMKHREESRSNMNSRNSKQAKLPELKQLLETVQIHKQRVTQLPRVVRQLEIQDPMH